MKVLVTGANGFIGRNLVSDFAAFGHSVKAAARDQMTQMPENVRSVSFPSLNSVSDFSATVGGCDVVIHAAARVHVMQEASLDPLAEFRAANVDGTIALARAAVVAGVRQFVFLSSIKVNGEETRNGYPFCPTDPSNPQDAYAVSKSEAESALLEIAKESGMAVTIIRPPLVYGPGVKGNFRTMMAVVARGLPLPLGGINNRRSLIYVKNLTSLIVTVALNPSAYGKVLLASDGLDLSTSALLRMIGDGLERPNRLLPMPQVIQKLALLVTSDNSAVRRLLGSLQIDDQSTCDNVGWSPPYSVEQGIAETTLQYLRSLNL